MLYKHPHTLCDGVVVEKGDRLFLYFANSQQHHSVSIHAILAKLGKANAETSEQLRDLFEFLHKKELQEEEEKLQR